jgi:putative transposase
VLLLDDRVQYPCRTTEISGSRPVDDDQGHLYAEDIAEAQVAIKAFEVDYGAKYPQAVAKIVEDTEVLLEFGKYPAEHWIHLRTTKLDRVDFATVRLRTKVTKGPRSRVAGIAMAYKLVDAPHLVALVRSGAVFHKGRLLERPPESPRRQPCPKRSSQPQRRSPETPPIHRY